MPFTTGNPALRQLAGARRYTVLEVIRFYTDLGYLITVPVGFISDLTSSWREGYWTRSAILHDWLFWSGIMTKAQSDAIFLEAMTCDAVEWATEDGKPAGRIRRGWMWVQRHFIHAGVRFSLGTRFAIGGQKAWNDHRTAGHNNKNYPRAIGPGLDTIKPA